MALYGSRWFPLAPYDSLLLNLAQCSSLWLPMNPYGSLWSSMALVSFLWLPMALLAPFDSFLAPFGSTSPILALFDTTQHNLAQLGTT